MKSYAVIDRYILGKYSEVFKVVGYYEDCSKAMDRANRLRRVLNSLHDVIIVPLVSLPRSEWQFLGSSEIDG